MALRFLLSIRLVVLLLVVGAASDLRAQPADAKGDQARITRAEAAFKKGVAAFDAGALEKALALYRESYALWPRARTLLNLALVTRKLGRSAEAANLFAQYLEDDAADEARLPAVRKALGELDAELGRLRIRASGQGEVTLDGVVVTELELARPIRVVAGAHRVAQGEHELSIEVGKAEEREVEIGAPPPPEPTPPPPAPAPAPIVPPPPPPAASPRRWYLWTAVPTAVAGVSALTFALVHRSQQNELDEILADPLGHDYADATSTRDRARRSALYTNLSLGVLGAGAIATVVLYVLHPKETSRPTVAIDGTGATIGWTAAW